MVRAVRTPAENGGAWDRHEDLEVGRAMAGVRMLARFELRRRWMTMVALGLLAGIGLGLMVAAVAWRFTAHAAYVAAEGLRSE